MYYEFSKILMFISPQIDTILLLNVSYDPALKERCVMGAAGILKGSETGPTNHQD